MSKKLVKIEVWECICDKCGHKWLTKTADIPKVCPRCKNLNWDAINKGKKQVLENMESLSKQFRGYSIEPPLEKGNVRVYPEAKEKFDALEDFEERKVDESQDWGA